MKKIILSLSFLVGSLLTVHSQCVDIHNSLLQNLSDYVFNFSDELDSETVDKLGNIVNYQVEVHYTDDCRNFLLQSGKANIFNLTDLSKLKTDSIEWSSDEPWTYVISEDSLTGSVTYGMVLVSNNGKYIKEIIFNMGGVQGEMSEYGPKTIKVIFKYPDYIGEEYGIFHEYGVFN